MREAVAHLSVLGFALGLAAGSIASGCTGTSRDSQTRSVTVTDSDAPKSAPLQLELELVAEPVGDHLGLSVPQLRVALRNAGREAMQVPKPGLPLVLSLHIVLDKDGDTVRRSTGTGKAVPIDLVPLAAGDSVRLLMSALDDGPGESELPVGTWRARVCVTPQDELSATSAFAAQFGGVCSNPVELAVTATGG